MPSFVALFLTMVLAVLPPGGSFVDDDGNVHEGSIEAIAAAGITKGCNPPTNNRYCPTQTVNRQQMAAFLTRALDLPATTTDYFTDDNGTLFENDINRLAEAGITTGCNPPDSDRFCPQRNMTRGQMAAMLARAFDYPTSTEDRFTDDNGHLFEADIQRIAAQGVTLGCNPPTNDKFCPDGPVTRDAMAS
ncbi:MAG: S-layer homology domain-containing protein, partial [Acidimicrobiia bacterium]|nr:S-layer homology domain-containing protein [Acidimicrobiia bacterium]